MAKWLCTCMTVLKNGHVFNFCFVGPVGWQQFIFICWRVISGGVAPKTGTGEVRAWSSTQWLGWPRVPQVQLCTDTHALLAQISFLSELVVTCLFTSDITEEDLEEAGVLDPAHKQILLQSLKQQQKIIWFYDPNQKNLSWVAEGQRTAPFVPICMCPFVLKNTRSIWCSNVMYACCLKWITNIYTIYIMAKS